MEVCMSRHEPKEERLGDRYYQTVFKNEYNTGMQFRWRTGKFRGDPQAVAGQSAGCSTGMFIDESSLSVRKYKASFTIRLPRSVLKNQLKRTRLWEQYSLHPNQT